MNFFEKIMAVWGKVSIVQRALLMAIVLTMGIIAALLTYWARLPDMQLLFAELNPEDAAKVTDKISEKNVPYELRNGGRSVYVPRNNVYQMRLELARDGLPGGEQGGYKLFDNEKIGISPFVQNVNLKRALQDELAKSIQMIEGVAQARVHIVSSDQTLFASGDKQTSASVVLKLRPGYKLGNSSIAAIANLIAGSVEGLKADNVTIVDGDGRLLSGQGGSSVAGTGGAGTVADYRQRVEQSLSEKVQQMLETVLGPGRATVRVSAEVNMTSVSTVTESYSPTAKVATKEEIKSNSEIEPASGGEAGKNQQPGTKKDETVTTEYVVGKTVEQKMIVPGEVTALSVAAVVDLSPAEANQTEGAQTAKIMQVTDVEKLIETALGLNLKGRDSLKVVEAKFFRPAVAADEAQQTKKLDYAVIAKQGSLGITAICALLVLKIFTKAKKKAAAEASAQAGASALPAGSEATGMLPGTTSAAEPVIVRRQLTEVMRNNPEQTRRLFVNWLQEKA
jgi:flagellar M-ring protein FliF